MLFSDGLNTISEFINNFSDSYFMATDIEENDKAYLLTIDMPGVKKENIFIEFEDDKLTLTVKTCKDEKKVNYIKRENFSSDYKRTYLLVDSDQNNVKAKLENGVLMIVVGKKTKEETKSVINID